MSAGVVKIGDGLAVNPEEVATVYLEERRSGATVHIIMRDGERFGIVLADQQTGQMRFDQVVQLLRVAT